MFPAGFIKFSILSPEINDYLPGNPFISFWIKGRIARFRKPCLGFVLAGGINGMRMNSW